MRLFITVPDSNDPVAFEVDSALMVEQLKRRLQDELSLSAAQITLYNEDSDSLENGKSLGAYGVKPGDTLIIFTDHPEAIKRDRAGNVMVDAPPPKPFASRRLTVPDVNASVQQHFAALRMADKLNGVDPAAKLSVDGPSGSAGVVSPGGSGQHKYGACSIKGMEYMNPKKENQDAYFVLDGFKKSFVLLGMFDGHGAYGKLASNYVRDKMPAILEKTKLGSAKTADCIRDTFVKTDKEMKREYKDRVGYSGTTAVVALLTADEIFVANAGDSRAVLAVQDPDSQTLKALDLSDDHKPDLPEERKRIEKSGGRVEPARDMETGEYFLPMRVWLKQINLPGLAMSRSLGDAVSHSIGVSPEAEVRHVKLDRNSQQFLILATDGVWEFMSSQQAVDFVAQHLHRGIQEACERLCKEAYMRWEEEGEGVADDTSAIILMM